MDHLKTDWAAMTLNDWIGMSLTVVVFVLMLAMYIYYLRPSKKAFFEEMKNIPFEEDKLEKGEKDV